MGKQGGLGRLQESMVGCRNCGPPFAGPNKYWGPLFRETTISGTQKGTMILATTPHPKP